MDKKCLFAVAASLALVSASRIVRRSKPSNFSASCQNAPVSLRLTLFRQHQRHRPWLFSQRDPYGQRAPNIRNTRRVGFNALRPVLSKRWAGLLA